MGIGHIAMLMLLATVQEPADVVPPLQVTKEPLHTGRVTPLFYGSFIELLDDHVPGMWAEMLNDRGFEGVRMRSWWCYYTGEPNICDRKWDANDTWSLDATDPYNGPQCAKLTATANRPAHISQQDLAVKKGMTYRFSGHVRGDGNLRLEVRLRALLPDDTWMTLASADLAKPETDWTTVTCDLVSKGTTDRAVFEVVATGTGTVRLDRLSLMPDDNVRGWRKDVVDAIRELKTPLIRWGGSAVDPGHYKWRECVGPRDERPPFDNLVWGRIDSNDVGIDEFLRFCELVGAEPLICVSFADGAESAGELAHYCNDPAETEWGRRRAENGHPEPYGVKRWQIGNELGNEEYVAGFTAICKAIKDADPEAVILASYPSEALLRTAGEYIDCVCPHFYREDYDNIEREIRETAEMARRVVPGRTIHVGVTEWNFTNPWGRDRVRLMTLESALETGKFLNLFYRNSDVVTLTCRSNMCNSLCDGIIQTRPSGLVRPPSYYVMQMYTERSLPVPIRVNQVPEGLNVSACMAEDGSSVYVFAVNTTWDPVALSPDLSALGAGFAPLGADCVCDTLEQRELDAVNHWTAPDRIRTIKLRVENGTVMLPPLSVTALQCGRR